MKKKVRSYLIIFLLFAVFFLSFSFQERAFNNVFLPDDELKSTTLTILTRHDVTITDEFTSRFLATPEAIALDITAIDFRFATTDAGWETLLADPSKSIDIAWGGGPALFTKMDNLGLLYRINSSADAELFTAINESVPYTLAGSSMKSFSDTNDLIWAANAISSFGFTVNHDFLSTYGLPIPTTWGELASPTYYISDSVKAISMGDPPLTTSNTRIYQIILQAFGWEEGWKILTRMGANAQISAGSVNTRYDVVSGDVGIAMTIDFYGVIANRENPSCEYIIPEGQSMISGDPIALGINVDDYNASVAFMKYIFSPEGQTAWMVPGIDRLPVNESAFHTPEGSTYIDLYELYNATINNYGILFNETLAVANLDTTIYYFHNTISQKHNLLRNAWGEMVTQLRDGNISIPEFVSLVDILGFPGMTQQESINWNDQYQFDATFAAEKDSEWRTYAETQYNSILDYFIVETPTPTPTPTPTQTPTQTETETTPPTTIVAIGILMCVISLLIVRKKKKR